MLPVTDEGTDRRAEISIFIIASLMIIASEPTKIVFAGPFNGYKIYVDIKKGENCRQFRLLTLTFLFVRSFIK